MRRQMPGFGHSWQPLVIAVALLGLAVAEHGVGRTGRPLSGVARAVDGDTIRLAGRRVRLVGIDAPELAQTCTGPDGQEWRCGAAARTEMAHLIANGTVGCSTSGDDVYGRPLADCHVGDVDLGRAMVVAGLAVADGNFTREEAAARQARVGIWNGSFTRPAIWRREHGETPPPNPFGHLLRWFR
jgi:endonuclease YncB( thermonuclease family)